MRGGWGGQGGESTAWGGSPPSLPTEKERGERGCLVTRGAAACPWVRATAEEGV